MTVIGYLAHVDGTRLQWDVTKNVNGTVTIGQDDTFACLDDAVESLASGIRFVSTEER